MYSDQVMPGLDTFRRAWSLAIYGIYSVLVLTYMITHIRRRKHIGVVQHGLATLTLESATWLCLGACYVLREWVLTARQDDLLWAQDLTWLTRLATAVFFGVGWAVSYSRAYVILVKFTRISSAKYALLEVRTARGQMGVIIMATLVCSLFYMIIELAGDYFCVGACMNHRRNALPNTYYLFTGPLGLVYAALINVVVAKCKKAGATVEKTSMLNELDVTGKFLGVQLNIQMVLYILVDARVIPYNAGFEIYSFTHMMAILFGLLFLLNVLPARRQGYGPFDRTNQVEPDDLEDEEGNKEDGAQEAGEASARPIVPSGAGEGPTSEGAIPEDAPQESPTPLFSSPSPAWESSVLSTYGRLSEASAPYPRRSSGSRRSSSRDSSSGQSGRRSGKSSSFGTGSGYGSHSGSGGRPHDDVRLIMQLMRRAQWLTVMKGATDNGASKANGLEALFTLARSMLTEEAVRCTTRLVRLLQIGGYNREELEEARTIYQAIMKDHLAPSATMPIDVPPWQRQQLMRLLTVCARRKVIFQDDFLKTVAELRPVIVILAPRVIPVLREFVRSEAVGRRAPTMHTTPRLPPTAEKSGSEADLVHPFQE